MLTEKSDPLNRHIVKGDDMKVKTKEDALLHCFDLWLWLACNPDGDKLGWPGWELNDGYLEECDNQCPCCEFTDEDKGCDDCPIDKWATDSTTRCYRYHKGEFRLWEDAINSEEKTRYALDIATLALDSLFKLKGI